MNSHSTKAKKAAIKEKTGCLQHPSKCFGRSCFVRALVYIVKVRFLEKSTKIDAIFLLVFFT